jgi:hypothetical protein
MGSMGFRSRSISLVTALLLTSLSLVRPARADTAPASPPAAAPVELREVVWGNRHGGMEHRQVPFQNNKILDGSDFYRAIGRDDLAHSYDSRMVGKRVLAGFGLAAGLVGGLMASVNMPKQVCDFPSNPNPSTIPSLMCHVEDGGAAYAAGLGMLIAGPVLLLVGVAIDPNPVSTDEQHRLLDAFNASLKTPAASIAPTVTPDGAGLVVSRVF